MTAVLVVVCAGVGAVAGWLSDPIITRVPRQQPVRGPALPDEPPPPHGRRIVVMVVCAALCGGVAAQYDDSWVLPAYVVLAIGLVVLSAIDLEHLLLPNRIVYPLGYASLALFTLAAVGDDDFAALGRGLIAAVVAFVVFFVLHMVSPRSMGFGDVRLSFILGLALGWLGWGEVFVGLFAGFVYGALVGVVLIVTRVRGRDQALPFGPFLAAGAMTAILVGTSIVDWYLH
jgi:leader peptidase (prepilin peptidase)/N-methyltransferase